LITAAWCLQTTVTNWFLEHYCYQLQLVFSAAVAAFSMVPLLLADGALEVVNCKLQHVKLQTSSSAATAAATTSLQQTS